MNKTLLEEVVLVSSCTYLLFISFLYLKLKSTNTTVYTSKKISETALQSVTGELDLVTSIAIKRGGKIFSIHNHFNEQELEEIVVHIVATFYSRGGKCVTLWGPFIQEEGSVSHCGDSEAIFLKRREVCENNQG